MQTASRMQAASWTGPGIILSGIAIPPSRYWRERSLPLHSMCARQFGAEERVQGPGLSPRPQPVEKVQRKLGFFI